MYKIKEENRDELTGGRTCTYLAKLCKTSRTHLNYLLTNYPKRKHSKSFVERIIINIATESVPVKERLEKYGLEETIKYYFEEI
jgi:hypothetical protein